MVRRFLFTADCHIKRRTWVNHVQPEGDSYEALRKLGRQLDITPPVTTLVLGGDFFDGNRPTSTDEVEAVKFLSGFKQVLYIRGNHDNVTPSYLEALLSQLTDVELIELTPEGVTLDKDTPDEVNIHGVSWTASREELLETLRSIPEVTCPQYVVLHTSFKHLLEIGSWQLSEDDITDIFGNRQVRILVGDVHTRNTLQLQHGYIHSPGSTYPCSWPRPGTTYAASLIDAVSGEITQVDCTVRDYTDVKYTGEEDLKKTIFGLFMHRELPPVIRLQVPSDVTCRINPSDYPDAIILIQKAVSGQNMDGVRPLYQAGVSVEDAVRQEAPSKEVADLAVSLMLSDDPAGLLDEWMNFWNVERIVL